MPNVYSKSSVTLVHNLRFLKFRSLLNAVILPVGLAASGLTLLASSSQAQTTNSVTICEYDPTSGFRNPLGSNSSLRGNAYIVAKEVNGITTFTYTLEPSLVIIANPPEENIVGNPFINRESVLSFGSTPLSAARQLLIDQPEYYATLLGITLQELGDRSFSEVDQTLSCRDETVTAGGTPGNGSDDSNSPTEGTIAALPDGNYRYSSADLPFRVITTEELLASEGTVFRFKKVGNEVSGDFFYPETDISICIEGTLDGDVLTGRAKLDGTEATVPDSDALSVSDRSMGGRFSNAVLDLTGFSRINAGTVLQRERCG